MPAAHPPVKRPCSDRGDPYLKMKELAAATGLTKATLLHYVRQKLLPEPVRTSPNMAWYPPHTVDRARFVKQVQHRHRLPLAAIRGLVRALDQGRDVAPLVELQAALFGRQGARRLSRSGFGRKTGLSEAQIDDLCDRGLIIPLEAGRFDAQDVALGRLLARGLRLGIRPADLAFYPRLAAEIVAREIALRNRHTREMGFAQDAGVTLELTGIARSLRAYVIDRTMQRELMRYQGLKPNPSDTASHDSHPHS
ncbi:MAG: MerR family transcriptional regulator [Desulfosarcinaceae bacterium]|nr:MerR family transcriptional regulator [Desulfosarcinaceae bacterium]